MSDRKRWSQGGCGAVGQRGGLQQEGGGNGSSQHPMGQWKVNGDL